jgi:replicative DNA helicase
VFLYRHQYYLEKEEPQKRPGEDPNKFSKRSLDWQAELDACTGQAELIVAKNRHGMTGTAKVRFDAERQRFEDMDARGGTVPPASDDPNDQWWAQQ